MAKQPSKPGIPVPNEDTDPGLGSGRHRGCVAGRLALAKAELLARDLEKHVDDDDDRLGGLTRDVEQVHRKVDAMDDRVGDLRVDVAKMSTVVDGISAAVTEQNEIRHVRVIAEVETGKVEKIAAIEDESDRKKSRRAFWLKVALVTIGAVGTVLGAVIEHFR